MNKLLWISIYDRVPDTKREVFANAAGMVCVGRYYNDSWHQCLSPLDGVMHWAEIEKPEPPREPVKTEVEMMKIKVNWTKDKPTESGYYHVINANGSPEPFVRWVVPGENDHIDEWYAAIGTPEPPREPAKVEMVGVVTDIDFSRPHWMDIRSSHGNIYIPDSAGKFTVGSHVRITMEEME